MNREESIADLNRSIARIPVIEKMLASRKPKLAKAEADFQEARKEAIKKAEMNYRNKTAKLQLETSEIERELNLIKKRILELSTDITRSAGVIQIPESVVEARRFA